MDTLYTASFHLGSLNPSLSSNNVFACIIAAASSLNADIYAVPTSNTTFEGQDCPGLWHCVEQVSRMSEAEVVTPYNLEYFADALRYDPNGRVVIVVGVTSLARA